MFSELDKGISKEELYEIINQFALNNDLLYTKKALELSFNAHDGQFRKEGTPYVIHPLIMARHAIALGIKDDDILSIILLHDVSEDCDITLSSDDFNETIRESVELLTYRKDTSLSRYKSKKKYFEKLAENKYAALVKAFDRCNNISSMIRGFSDAKIKRYIKETIDFVYPILDRIEEMWPEYTDCIFDIRYQMDSVISTIILSKPDMV